MGKVIVTGCSGFIGREVVRSFSEQHVEVIGISRKVDVRSRKHAHVSYLSLDLNNREDVSQLSSLGKVSAVVHCAGESVSSNENNGFPTIENNFNMTSLLLDYAVKQNVGKFIFLSTKKINTPKMLESDAYTLSKNLCEALVSYCNVRYGKQYISLRLCNVYGEDGDESRIIPFLAKKIINNQQVITNSAPDTVVELCSVEHVIDIIVTLLSNDDNDSGIKSIDPEFNASISTLEHSIRNVVSYINEGVEQHAELSLIERRLFSTLMFYCKTLTR